MSKIAGDGERLEREKEEMSSLISSKYKITKIILKLERVDFLGSPLPLIPSQQSQIIDQSFLYKSLLLSHVGDGEGGPI